MKPQYLQMKNFGPYQEEVIDFTCFDQQPLFLISGKTGSGKTTIFDGICFALFGETSGGSRKGEEMRSNFAKPSEATEVTFTFRHFDKIYEIYRAPKQQLAKKKGDGLMERALRARLTVKNASGEEVAQYTKVGEVNQRISEVLHLNAQQFCQIVLLPQGEFRRFLNANSNEKEQLLRKLFGTEIFEKLAENLKNKAKNYGKELEIKELQLRGQLAQIYWEETQVADFKEISITEGLELAGKVQVVLDEKQKLLKEEIKQITTEKSKLEETLTLSQQLQALYLEKADLLAQQQLLTDRLPEMKAQEAELKVLQWSQKQRLLVENAQHAATSLEESEKVLGLTQVTLTKMAADQLILEEKLNELLAESQNFAELQQEIQKMQMLAPLFMEYQQLQQKLIEKNQSLVAKETAYQSMRQNKIQLEEAKQLLKSKINRLEEQTSQEKELQTASFKVTNWLTATKQLIQEEQKLTEKQVKLVSFQEQLESAVAIFTEVQGKYLTQRSKVAKMQIARLSLELLPGEPCPVCGSVAHESMVQHEIGTLEEIISAEQQLQVLEDDFQKKQEEKQRLEERIANEMEEMQLLQEQLEVQTTEFFAALNVEKELPWALLLKMSDTDLTMYTLTEVAESFSIAETNLDEKLREIQQFSQELTVKKNTLLTNEVAEKELTDSLDLENQQLQALQADLAKLQGQETTLQQQLVGEWSLDYELFKGALLEKEVAFNTYYQEKENLSKQVGQSREAYKLKENDQKHQAKQVVDHQQLLAESQAVLEKTLKTAPVALTLSELVAHLEKADLTEKITDEITTYKQENHFVEKRLGEIIQQIGEAKEPDTAPLLEVITSLEAQLTALLKQQYELSLYQEKNQQIISQVATGYQAIQTKWQSFTQLKLLASVANGDGVGNKLGIERFVLQIYLREVLAVANQRLKVLSQGRYQFQLNGESASRKNHSGLEIDVYDDEVGSFRSVNTLSGGESFIAALALSLALGEVIQNHAGGVSVEALFIDEGFGSLDDEALEMALGALESIESKGRIIGIISHVKALKEQIAKQIQVESLGNGQSKIKMT